MNEVNKKREDIKSGLALASSFLILSVFFYLEPQYFGLEVISKIASVLFAIIGVIGLGIELNKLNDEKPLGFDNLGIGLGLGAIWAIIYYYYPIWWVNLLTLTILMISIYATVLGVIGILDNLIFGMSSLKNKLLVRLPIIIVQLSAFILTILQILQITKISR